MKNVFTLLIIGLLATSCNWLIKKSPNQEEILNEEIAKINWNVVDEIPSLKICDSITNNVNKEQCLYDNLSQIIQTKFDKQVIKLNNINVDTIWVSLILDKDSTITAIPDLDRIADIEVKMELDSIIKSRLDSMPHITPGIKRGIPVKTEFKFPLAILR